MCQVNITGGENVVSVKGCGLRVNQTVNVLEK